MNSRIDILTTLVSGLLMCMSCNSKQTNTTDRAAKDYPVLRVVPQSTTLNTSFPATIEGQQNIEIRPKIDGYIEKIFVDEGAIVKKGQMLFKINAPQYEQEVRTASANIKIAQADVKTAEMEVNKIQPLVERNIISSYELDAAKFNLQSKRAALAQAQATLVNGQTNLAYTRITSPVNGVVGSIPHRTGSLVSSTTVDPLTVVSNIDEVYAYFSVNEKQVLQYARDLEGRTTKERLASIPPVTLILSNGFEFPQKGRIEATSGIIDQETRALRIRATFPNPDYIVRSGASGTVRIPASIDSAILIPQKATYEIQGKTFVYQVTEDQTVTGREVEKMNNTDGQFYVVEKGLKAGDKIVMEGVAGLREGAPIIPIEVNADSVYSTVR